MTESLNPQPTAQELQAPDFEPVPRQFDANDVVHVQKYMQQLHNESVADGADYVPNQNGLYEALTEVTDVSVEAEPRADEHSFDKSINALLTDWGERAGIPGEAPKTLQETIDVFTQNTKLNDTSPIHFQGGAEFQSGRFVHVATGRAMGKHREPATRRYYLNPRADKLGHVVEQLTGAALQSEVPLYFKFVNVATGNPSKRTLARSDRVVIYASEAQSPFVEGLLKDISDGEPEAFAGRKIAGFGEVLADGITAADDVTIEQNEKFKGHSEGTSFNNIRSKLIHEATLGVTRDLITFPEFASVKIGNQTIRQKFATEVTKEISKKRPGTVIAEGDPTLLRAIELGLTDDGISSSGEFGDGAARAIQTAVGRVARDVLPRIQADSLLQGYRHHITGLAPKFGVDPNNLAKNIPVAA